MLPNMPSDNPMGRLLAFIGQAEQMLAEFSSSTRTLGATTVDHGDLTVQGGGNVVLRDRGKLLMYDENGTLVGSQYVAGLDFLDPDTGGAMSISRGLMRLWDDYENNPDRPGRIRVDQGRGINCLRMFPPYETGTGLENSVSIRGAKPSQAGAVFVYTDGLCQVSADDAITLNAKSVVLNTTGEEMPVYGLPTTSAGSNLHLGTVGGKWTMAYVTSSRRYKQDIKDAPIDPAAALSWRPRVWRDISEVKAVGGKAMTHIGFIAEEVAEVSPEFVVYDGQGRPDSLNYDRMVAGTVAAIQAQEKRAAEDRAKMVALEAKVGALQGKVDAQDQQIAALKDANAALGLRLDKVGAALKKLGVSP